MYYESVPHRSQQVESPEEAARLIRSGNIMSFIALIWKNSRGERIAAVSDGGLDDSWGEVTVINIDTDRQLESITFPWCSEEESARILRECQDSGGISSSPARLPLDGGGEANLSIFTCGCCGEGFKSTIAKQRIHDQDQGYGFCPECVQECAA